MCTTVSLVCSCLLIALVFVCTISIRNKCISSLGNNLKTAPPSNGSIETCHIVQTAVSNVFNLFSFFLPSLSLSPSAVMMRRNAFALMKPSVGSGQSHSQCLGDLTSFPYKHTRWDQLLSFLACIHIITTVLALGYPSPFPVELWGAKPKGLVPLQSLLPSNTYCLVFHWRLTTEMI